MKRAGIILILLGLLCVLAFALYTVVTQPDIPFLIKLGITSAIVGIVIVIASLGVDRFTKKRKGDEDDLSKY